MRTEGIIAFPVEQWLRERATTLRYSILRILLLVW